MVELSIFSFPCSASVTIVWSTLQFSFPQNVTSTSLREENSSKNILGVVITWLIIDDLRLSVQQTAVFQNWTACCFYFQIMNILQNATRCLWATSLTWERLQFKSINTYNSNIIMLIKRRKKPLFTLWELNGSSFEQNWIPFTQDIFVPNLVEISFAVL